MTAAPGGAAGRVGAPGSGGGRPGNHLLRHVLGTANARRRRARELLRYRPDEPEAVVTQAAITVIETPANPSMSITDIERVAGLAHSAGGLVVCDNTFATPLLTRPLDLGVDIVVHSGSKYLAGHSDVYRCHRGADRHLADRLFAVRTRTGGTPGVLEAFLTTRGMRTLALRMERSCSNSAELARRLDGHPGVDWVRYPGLPDHPGHSIAARQMAGGFGAVVAFSPAGGAEQAEESATPPSSGPMPPASAGSSRLWNVDAGTISSPRSPLRNSSGCRWDARTSTTSGRTSSGPSPRLQAAEQPPPIRSRSEPTPLPWAAVPRRRPTPRPPNQHHRGRDDAGGL